MTIDWITVSAQIVNFLVLVWLLKHFLYQPVIRAMERREQHITGQLNEAQAREQKADEKILYYQDKTEELTRRNDELLAKAREEAQQEKRHLLDEARAEVAETRTHWQRQTQQEKEEFLGNLRHQTSDAIQAIARQVLIDLADANLEEQITYSFINRLKSLDKESHKILLASSKLICITSTFELDSTLRDQLTRAIHEHLIDSAEVEYTQSSELLCGIELTSGAGRLSWNLADYLEKLNERIEEAFAPLASTNEERK